MNKRQFKLWNRIVALAVLTVACVTYLATIESSAPFWDCGEFTASSYKLEVGHPPGNPVFQLVARLFSMFTGPEHAAVAVNAMSAICSGLTIFFLYLTIVFFARRLVRKEENAGLSGPDGTSAISMTSGYSVAQSVAIFASGAVGALAYCFSDTFWFSAVESEVYAMSSLFTALVFWAMTKWYEQADQPYANRWIVLIAFLMGLSIGVHLLNLLTIPAIVFMFYYRKKEDGRYTFKQFIGIGLLSIFLLGLLFFVLVPYIPKMAAWTDLFFVNVLHLPVNSGAAFFMLAIIGLCFWGIWKAYSKDKPLLSTTLLCLNSILIGFSIFSIIIIRSSIKPPTNENQPDNAFSLVRYLSREQYGSTPLLYGQYFDAPYDDLHQPTYYTLVDGRYKKVDSPAEPVYADEGKMLFPRMWSNTDDRFIQFYQYYTDGKGKSVRGADHKKPTFGANMRYFFDYQLGWMYWRYFMWNFAGRQNDIHSPSPGEIYYGNWECGIKFIDELRLGDQSNAPDPLKNNKGKNHYYLLPLLLGIVGLCFQFDRDKRGTWVVFLLFILTGIAIVVYLNQPPYQVRERDYAYAGSFYAFSIWIGFAVLALYQWIADALKGKYAVAAASVVSLLCLGVPALMAQQNWDDHNRHNRATAPEMASNYLNSVGQNGLLVTHGDNDTFPLWYAQEIESVRPDVRICNTSLLGTDWYIDQMRYAINDSPRIDLQVPQEMYLYGTNDYVMIVDTQDKVVPISIVMKVFKDPQYRVTLQSGARVDYIMSHKISIPVNKENVLKYGILPEEPAGGIPDEIVITIPKDKKYISKPELWLLDVLSNYQWDRPLAMLNRGGDLNIGIKPYLLYQGFSYLFVPVKDYPAKGTEDERAYAGLLYDKVKNVYKWDALKRTDWCVDYQNLYTFMGVMPQRDIFLKAAQAQLNIGEPEKAFELLQMCEENVPEANFPLESGCIGFYQNDMTVMNIVEAYGEVAKALRASKDTSVLGSEAHSHDLAVAADSCAMALAGRFEKELMQTLTFYAENIDWSGEDFNLCCQFAFYLHDIYKSNGRKEDAKALHDKLTSVLSSLRIADDLYEEDDSTQS